MPRQHPAGSEIAEIIQDSFGFRDEGFCDYLNLRSPDHVPVKDMLDIVSSMDTDVHPLVAYGAGWVLAEAATRRVRADRRNDFPSEARQEALDDAEQYWEDAEEGFKKLRPTATSMSEAKSFQTMGFNAGFALSTLPVMELIAEWRCGEEVTPAYVEMVHEETRENLLDMGVAALKLYEKSGGALKRKVGAQCEKLFGALCMHNDVTLAYAPSLRHKLLASRGQKSDFVTVGRWAPHTDTQVRMARPSDDLKSKLFFIYRRDLAPYGTTVEQNLASYITEERGGTISPEEAEILDDVESQISERFEEEQMKPSRQTYRKNQL